MCCLLYRGLIANTLISCYECCVDVVLVSLQVVFATPGMLHAGLSLQIFKKWASDEKNMVCISASCSLQKFSLYLRKTLVWSMQAIPMGRNTRFKLRDFAPKQAPLQLTLLCFCTTDCTIVLLFCILCKSLKL